MPAANTAVNTACPRCGGGFHCGVQDSTPCPCTTLNLDPALIKALEARFLGCLCIACLAELQAGSRTAD